jgi:hypothetical protein
MENTQTVRTAVDPSKVGPLLAQLNRVEDLTSTLSMRLDPITVHHPTEQTDKVPNNTVTNRLQSVGDALQYLLDSIEL